jgi:hypothetical protein
MEHAHVSLPGASCHIILGLHFWSKPLFSDIMTDKCMQCFVLQNTNMPVLRCYGGKSSLRLLMETILKY